MLELIDIINSKNQKIKTASRQEAHEKALRHRVAACFLFRTSHRSRQGNQEDKNFLVGPKTSQEVRNLLNKGKVYLQLRSKHKKIAANVWDKSMGEHVQAGETFKQACKRGLREELGITRKLTLTKIGEYNILYREKGLTEREIVWLYIGHYSGKIKLDKKEVAKGDFYSIKEADKIYKLKKISPSFRLAWPIFKKLLNKKYKDKWDCRDYWDRI